MSYVEASLAASNSSGASLSGATDLSGGGNYGGVSYGPGSLILGGAADKTPITPAAKTGIWIAVIFGAVLIVTAFLTRNKGGP